MNQKHKGISILARIIGVDLQGIVNHDENKVVFSYVAEVFELSNGGRLCYVVCSKNSSTIN